MAITVHSLPVLRDNYAYVVDTGGSLLIVDPGEAGPVLEWLKRQDKIPAAILITHLHHDHIGGVSALREAYANIPVFSPAPFSGARDAIPVVEGQGIDLAGLAFEVLDLPGHASPHVGYFLREEGILFVGDVLIGGACGRLFGHPPELLYTSLRKVAALPPETLLYFGHEYTEANMRFALTVDPENPALIERIGRVEALRRDGLPTVPTTLAEEMATNPFVRCGELGFRSLPGLRAAASDLEVFTVLRRMKDQF